MKTLIPSGKDLPRKWFIVDAKGKVLGRVATQVARVLMGKHKPTFTPFIDTGDHVVVINADQVVLTGQKEEQKIYRRHTGYPGGLIETSAKDMRSKRPIRLVEEAVKGMLPKSKMGKHMYTKLKVYPGAEHPHDAQQPETLAV